MLRRNKIKLIITHLKILFPKKQYQKDHKNLCCIRFEYKIKQLFLFYKKVYNMLLQFYRNTFFVLYGLDL